MWTKSIIKIGWNWLKWDMNQNNDHLLSEIIFIHQYYLSINTCLNFQNYTMEIKVQKNCFFHSYIKLNWRIFCGFLSSASPCFIAPSLLTIFGYLFSPYSWGFSLKFFPEFVWLPAKTRFPKLSSHLAICRLQNREKMPVFYQKRAPPCLQSSSFAFWNVF